MRLDRYLSEYGKSSFNASRSDFQVMIKRGLVTVNSEIIRDCSYKIDENKDRVVVDNITISVQKTVLACLYKPAGFVTSTNDPFDRTVMELIPAQYACCNLLPVGRLDKDTEGLLLFTNNGALLHNLISPKKQIWKKYYAVVDKKIEPEDIKAFENGIVLKDGTVCRKAKLEIAGENECYVTICEGQYHQVKRMLASRSKHVTYLRRDSFGSLSLGDMKKGEFRIVDQCNENS